MDDADDDIDKSKSYKSASKSKIPGENLSFNEQMISPTPSASSNQKIQLNISSSNMDSSKFENHHSGNNRDQNQG